MLEVIDQEDTRITDECYQHAIDAVTEHREQLDAVARALLERETLDETDACAAAGIHSRSHLPPVITTSGQ